MRLLAIVFCVSLLLSITNLLVGEKTLPALFVLKNVLSEQRLANETLAAVNQDSLQAIQALEDEETKGMYLRYDFNWIKEGERLIELIDERDERCLHSS